MNSRLELATQYFHYDEDLRMRVAEMDVMAPRFAIQDTEKQLANLDDQGAYQVARCDDTDRWFAVPLHVVKVTKKQVRFEKFGKTRIIPREPLETGIVEVGWDRFAMGRTIRPLLCDQLARERIALEGAVAELTRLQQRQAQGQLLLHEHEEELLNALEEALNGGGRRQKNRQENRRYRQNWMKEGF